jgi:hypothetical protein
MQVIELAGASHPLHRHSASVEKSAIAVPLACSRPKPLLRGIQTVCFRVVCTNRSRGLTLYASVDLLSDTSHCPTPCTCISEDSIPTRFIPASDKSVYHRVLCSWRDREVLSGNDVVESPQR